MFWAFAWEKLRKSLNSSCQDSQPSCQHLDQESMTESVFKLKTVTVMHFRVPKGYNLQVLIPLLVLKWTKCFYGMKIKLIVVVFHHEIRPMWPVSVSIWTPSKRGLRGLPRRIKLIMIKKFGHDILNSDWYSRDAEIHRPIKPNMEYKGRITCVKTGGQWTV
jgi:hypothetical protein